MRNNPYVDLHIRSYYSDGSLSPAEIVCAALKNNVGVLTVSDRDVIELSRLCAFGLDGVDFRMKKIFDHNGFRLSRRFRQGQGR